MHCIVKPITTYVLANLLILVYILHDDVCVFVEQKGSLLAQHRSGTFFASKSSALDAGKPAPLV